VLFPTPTFAIFFAAVLPLSWLLMSHPRIWRPAMLVACYVFYAAWDWRFVLVLAGSTLGNQAVAIAIDRRERGRLRKWLLIIGIGANLAVLGYVKYEDFFLTSAHNLGAWVGLDIPVPMAAVLLPVGISFYTFHALAYLVDTYRETSRPTTLAKFAVYLSFFPHLVAGPISRPHEFVPQLDKPRDARRIDSSRAYLLIAGGLFKKLVIANELATRIVDPVFGAPGRHSSLELLCGVYGYAIQIWADFSGYTDIAIGVALLLGFRLPQNFNAPYTALSLTDFWGRWHMTLSRWLRDYLFFPLAHRYAVGAASRVTYRERVGTYWSLLLTMLLAGLWHGAGWTFVAWGAIHGGGLASERAYRDLRRARGLPAPRPTVVRTAVHRIVTFNVVCLAWIFFRADSLSTAGEVLTGLFTQWGEGAPLVTAGVLLTIAAGIAWQYVPARVPDLLAVRFSRVGFALQGAVLAVCLAIVAAMGPEGVAPFIYFRF
jgi:D-alanyl-lipoteichoic acid acyltransferase DltB (MBOAT superfamily)